MSEIFYFDIDPRFRNFGYTNAKINQNDTEIDSFKLVQTLAAGNDETIMSSIQNLQKNTSLKKEQIQNQTSTFLSSQFESSTFPKIQTKINLPMIQVQKEDKTPPGLNHSSSQSLNGYSQEELTPSKEKHFFRGPVINHSNLIIDTKLKENNQQDLSPIPSMVEEGNESQGRQEELIQQQKNIQQNLSPKRRTIFLTKLKKVSQTESFKDDDNFLSPLKYKRKNSNELKSIHSLKLEENFMQKEKKELVKNQFNIAEQINPNLFQLNLNPTTIALKNEQQVQNIESISNNTISEESLSRSSKLKQEDIKKIIGIQETLVIIDSIQKKKKAFDGIIQLYNLENSVESISQQNQINLTWESENEELQQSNSFISLNEDERSQDLKNKRLKQQQRQISIKKEKNLFLNSSFISEYEAVKDFIQKKPDQFDFHTPKNYPQKYKIYDFNEPQKIKIYKKINKDSAVFNEFTKFKNKMVGHKKNEKKKQEENKLIAEQVFACISHQQFIKFADLLDRFITLDLEMTDKEGNTFLNFAVQMGSYEISEQLLKKGANVNTQNNTQNTPLHYAKAYNFMKIFELLISYKANQNITNEKGKTLWEGIV